MELVTVVVAAALVEYMIFGYVVGKARGKYNIAAPSVAGHEMFERYFRIHQNTLESLIIFIPAIYSFGYYVSVYVALGMGVLFIVGRAVYFVTYARDPKKRALGVLLSSFASVFLLVGGVVGAVRNLI